MPKNEEILIHRLMERTASPRDLRDLAALAEADVRAWDRVAAALRAETALERAVERRVARADAVELAAAPKRGPWVARVIAISGWAVAAAAVLFLGIVPSGRLEMGGGASDPVSHERSAVSQLGDELPRLLIDAVPHPGGVGFDVTYLRRFVERATVPALLEWGTDEHGRPAVAPANLARHRAPESL